MKTRACLILRSLASPLVAGVMLAFCVLLPGAVLADVQLNVDVNGLTGPPLANVQASLAIGRHSGNTSFNAELIHQLHNQAEADIKRALEPFGFYRPTIHTRLLPPTGVAETWQGVYIVDAGPQIPIAQLDVQFAGAGIADANLLTLSKDMPLREESALDHRVYENARATLLDQVKELGYLDAAYSRHQVEVDLARYRASIYLHIDTGPRYVIGTIDFEQRGFAPDYLAQYLVIASGDPFSQKQITAQRKAFSRSGYFVDVAIEQGKPSDAEPKAIPLLIRLQSYKPNRYRIRTGWGTDTGFGLQTDWTRRFIGRRGHNFNLGLTAVEDRNRLAGDLRYLIPLEPLTGTTIELGLRHESKDLTYKDVELDEGGETRIATNLALANWQLADRELGSFVLQSSVGLSAVGESYDVFEVLFGNLSREAQKAIVEKIGSDAFDILAPNFKALVPGVRLNLKRSDDPLYIRRGDYLNLEVLAANESLGSNISFWQLRLNSWNIWSIGEGSRVLLRTAAGYTKVDSDIVLGVNFNQVPEYYEFRAGGARSVRGYGFESLFPSDAITGGKHQLVASIEYEYEIIPNWSVAVFLDGGNAFNDFDNIDEKYGAGLGVRWRSPVGLARLDFGVPLDEADDSFQIYITIGPEF